MVEREIRYHRYTFKGYRGVTQGDPLYHNIFNLIVNVFLHPRVNEVAGEEWGLDRFVKTAGQTTTFFYADDGILESTRADRL